MAIAVYTAKTQHQRQLAWTVDGRERIQWLELDLYGARPTRHQINRAVLAQ